MESNPEQVQVTETVIVKETAVENNNPTEPLPEEANKKIEEIIHEQELKMEAFDDKLIHEAEEILKEALAHEQPPTEVSSPSKEVKAEDEVIINISSYS